MHMKYSGMSLVTVNNSFAQHSWRKLLRSVVCSKLWYYYLHKTKNRLYGCLRIAMGWIIFHIRSVDDGRFRRSVCEALFVCYLLQAIAVLRAQFTERQNVFNWVAICLLSLIGFCYGRFRFGKGGNMIKVYELPQSNKTMRWHTYIFTQKMIVHIIEGTQINHNILLLFC